MMKAPAFASATPAGTDEATCPFLREHT
jgi:hypothetical protein